LPGKVLTQETIDFMRKLDVKEIHGTRKPRPSNYCHLNAIAAKAKR